MSTFKEELESAVKARRERGDCGPYATGEENDLVAYHEVVDYIQDGFLSPRGIRFETKIPLEFIAKVFNDLGRVCKWCENNPCSCVPDDEDDEPYVRGLYKKGNN